MQNRMMKDQKTIKEFADDLGVTRQTIHYYLSKKLSKELSKERTKNEKGIVVLTSLEQDIIKKSGTCNSLVNSRLDYLFFSPQIVEESS